MPVKGHFFYPNVPFVEQCITNKMDGNMILNVNNQPFETKADTLGKLAEEMALPSQGVAMAVDNCMIPRAEWDNCILNEEMKIVIIRAACGG